MTSKEAREHVVYVESGEGTEEEQRLALERRLRILGDVALDNPQVRDFLFGLLDNLHLAGLTWDGMTLRAAA